MTDPLSEKLWIVIPTYNRANDLLACLESLIKADIPAERIVVVDNHSTDDTVEQVRVNHPAVQLIPLAENLGATGAANAGFDAALAQGADYILRLDSDTIVAPDFIRPLLEVAAFDPMIGVVSPKIYFHDPPDVIWYAGVDAKPFIFGTANDRRFEHDSSENSQLREVAYIWAAAMLIKREVLEKTGGFDTDFFVYHEEIDFCERVRALGYRLMFVPNAFVWHKVGSSANSSWTAFHWGRSKIILYRKQARNVFHKIFLILYAFFYALMDSSLNWLKIRHFSRNRGPLKDALRGLWAGLTAKLTQPESAA